MPKNPALEYQASEPAFLRRMKAGQAALNGKHEVQIPRARGGIGRNERLNMDDEEGEDDPVMLDEGGNIVSKEEMANMTRIPSDSTKQHDGVEQCTISENGGAVKPQISQDAKVSSGMAKRRRVAKMIGEEEEKKESSSLKQDQDKDLAPTKSFKQSTRDLQDVVKENREATKKDSADGVVTKKQKRKKVKLSFDDPEQT